jgi:hypothetical protein
MISRREILRLIPLTSCAAATRLIAEPVLRDSQIASRTRGLSLTISPGPENVFEPLDRVRIESAEAGRILVRDGDQKIYLDTSLQASLNVTIGGALGTHSVTLLSRGGQVLDETTFFVDCSTHIDDEGGVFGGLLKDLCWTMVSEGPVSALRYKGEVFTFFDSWLMDNTQTLKGMKYFWPELKSNVDFYANTQREDGMIWENFEARTPPETDWDRRFRYADFARSTENGYMELRRAPVEAHVEQFFLESIYYTWKATGDSKWMAGKLNAAKKAVHYVISDPYRWSDKYELIRRGYTIDTWDFLSDSEAKLVDGDIMKVDLKATHFGIFFGDNANMIVGLHRLIEMLKEAGRESETAEYLQLANRMEKRLNELAWNGEFFTHWIPEDRSLKLDLGVDINRQVSLSNAYSLNRGISHEQSVGIIKTYQRIRREMPSTSPGEFYAIYPPFERGFAGENGKWEYMNGGVMSCTAGELAHGAFENGFEQYGADILRREKAIADRYRGIVPAILRGAAPQIPTRTLTPLDIRSIANADFGNGKAGVPGWTNEGENNLAAMPVGRHVLRGIPFDVIDPSTNDSRACVGISNAPGFIKKQRLPIHATARAFYLLHTKGGEDLVGKLTIRFEDGSSHFEYIRAGVNVNHWWGPKDSEFDNRYGSLTPDRMQVAWRGGNPKFGNVGVYVVGFENPEPAKPIAALDFESMETDAHWMILGVTLSDAPVFLPPWNDLSTGMPNNWGAAALVYALIGGLAGVKDTGIAFDSAVLAPRWNSANVNASIVSVRYPASRGYVRYDYRYDKTNRRIAITFTGNADRTEIAVLLPSEYSTKKALLDGKEVAVKPYEIEGSNYASILSEQRGAHTLELLLI